MAFFDSVRDFFQRLIGRTPPPLPPPPPPTIQHFRNSKVRMYYAKNKKRVATPTPFAEFRVFMITQIPMNKISLNNTFDKTLNKMEWIFKSFYLARIKDAVDYVELGKGDETSIKNRDDMKDFLYARGKKTEAQNDYITITGREENVPIDKDEAEETLFTTGLVARNTRGQWENKTSYGETYRYFAIFTDMGEIDHDYSEREIRLVEVKRALEIEEWEKDRKSKGTWTEKK